MALLVLLLARTLSADAVTLTEPDAPLEAEEAPEVPPEVTLVYCFEI